MVRPALFRKAKPGNDPGISATVCSSSAKCFAKGCQACLNERTCTTLDCTRFGIFESTGCQYKRALHELLVCDAVSYKLKRIYLWSAQSRTSRPSSAHSNSHTNIDIVSNQIVGLLVELCSGRFERIHTVVCRYISRTTTSWSSSSVLLR
jgi:hypothetical protein